MLGDAQMLLFFTDRQRRSVENATIAKRAHLAFDEPAD
jgi:hypothetical protein